MSRSWIGILVIIIAGATGLAMPAFAQPTQGVAPPSGQPGATFTVTAGGLTPGEQVGSWLQPPTGRALDATPYLVADAQGFVSWQWSSPASAQSGAWQAVSQGRVSRKLVALTFTVTGANAPAAVQQRERVTVQPQRAAPGATLVFTLAGYERNEEVGYWPTQPDGVADTSRRKPIIVAGDGRAELHWEVPERAVGGAWVMTFRGRATQREVRVPFEVIDAAPVTPASVDPQLGAPGTSFTFQAYGFRPIERLDTWLERPDGTLQRGPTGARANGDGLVVWRWTAPGDAPGGPWTMVARGQDSERTERIGFTLERTAPGPTAMASVAPERGGYGSTFTFSAAGFRPGERVGYWLNLPDGTIVRFTDELGADDDGRVTWTYVAVPGRPQGRYLLALRSSQSDAIDNDVSHALAFVVE